MADPTNSAGLTPGQVAWAAASTLSFGLCAYHGAKRNGGSIFWGGVWGVAGGVAPIFAPAIALAQGLGEAKAAPAPSPSSTSVHDLVAPYRNPPPVR